MDGLHINLKVHYCWFKAASQSLLNSLNWSIVVQGFAIGNGLTDPVIQYKAYTDYALDMGVIHETEYKRINKIYPACELAIKLCGNSCWF